MFLFITNFLISSRNCREAINKYIDSHCKLLNTPPWRESNRKMNLEEEKCQDELDKNKTENSHGF